MVSTADWGAKQATLQYRRRSLLGLSGDFIDNNERGRFAARERGGSKPKREWLTNKILW